jgi:hypothetical protein
MRSLQRCGSTFRKGLALFYRKSFKNGEERLSAMEAAVDAASVFVFFASKDSIESHWVKFEVDNARLAKIKRPNLRILSVRPRTS